MLVGYFPPPKLTALSHRQIFHVILYIFLRHYSIIVNFENLFNTDWGNTLLALKVLCQTTYFINYTLIYNHIKRVIFTAVCS